MIDKLVVFNNRNKIFLKIGVISILLIILISAMQINPQNAKIKSEKSVTGTAMSVDYTIVYDVASKAFYKNNVLAENALTPTDCTDIGVSNSEDGLKIIFDGVNLTSTADTVFSIIGDATIELTENSDNSITSNSSSTNVVAINANNSKLIIDGTGTLSINMENNNVDDASNYYVYGIKARILQIDNGEIGINMPNINKTNGNYFGIDTIEDTKIDTSAELSIVANGNSSKIYGIESSGNIENYGDISIKISNNNDNDTVDSTGIYVENSAYLGKEGEKTSKIDINIQGYGNSRGINAENIELKINNSQINVNMICLGMGSGFGIYGKDVKIENNSRVVSINNGNYESSCGVGGTSISIANSFVESKNTNISGTGGSGIKAESISIDGGKVIAAGGSGGFGGIATSNVTLTDGTDYDTQVLAAFEDINGDKIVTYDSAQLGNYKNIIIGKVYNYGLRFDSSTGVMSKINLSGYNIGTITENDLYGWTTKELRNEEGDVESYILVLQGLDFISEIENSLEFIKSTTIELKDNTISSIGNIYSKDSMDYAFVLNTKYDSSNDVDLNILGNTGQLDLEMYNRIKDGETYAISSENNVIIDGGIINVYNRAQNGLSMGVYGIYATSEIKVQNNCKLNIDIIGEIKAYMIGANDKDILIKSSEIIITADILNGTGIRTDVGKIIFDNSIFNIESLKAREGQSYVIHGETGVDVKNGSDIRINGEFLDSTVETNTEDNKVYKYQQYMMMTYGDVNISNSKVYMDYDAYYAASIISFDGNTNISNADVDIIAKADDMEGISAYSHNATDTTNIGKVNIDMESVDKSNIYMKVEPMTDGTNGVKSSVYGIYSNCNVVNIDGTTIISDMISNFYYNVIRSLSNVILKNIDLDMTGKAPTSVGVASYGGNIEIIGSDIKAKDIKADYFYGIYTYEKYVSGKTDYKGDITIQSSKLNIKAEQITEESELDGIWSEWGNICIQDNCSIDMYLNAKGINAIYAYTKTISIDSSRVDLETYTDISNGYVNDIFAYDEEGKIIINNSNVDICSTGSKFYAIATFMNKGDCISLINSNIVINIKNIGNIGKGVHAAGSIKVIGGKLIINVDGESGDGIYSENIELKDCETSVDVNNSDAYGIKLSDTGSISISGGTTIVQSGNQAFNKAPTLDPTNSNLGVILASTDYNGATITGYNSSNISNYKYIVIGQVEPYELKYYPSSGEVFASELDTPLTKEELANRGIIIDENKAFVLNNVNMTTTQKVGLWIIGDVDIKLANNSENNLVSEGNTESDYYGIKAIGDVTITGNGTINCSKTNAADSLSNYYGVYSEYNVILEKGDLNIVTSSTSNTGNTYGISANNTKVNGGNTKISVSANNTMSYGIKCVENYESTAGAVSITMDNVAVNTNGVACDNDINIMDGSLEISAYNVLNKEPIINKDYASMIEATNRSNTSVRPAISSNYASYNHVLIESNYYLSYSDGKMYKNDNLAQEITHIPNWSVGADNKLILDDFVFNTSAIYGVKCVDNTSIELKSASKNHISNNYYTDNYRNYSYVILGQKNASVYTDVSILGTGTLDLDFAVSGKNKILNQFAYGVKANNINIKNPTINICGKGYYLRGISTDEKIIIENSKINIDLIDRFIGARAINTDKGVEIKNSVVDIDMESALDTSSSWYGIKSKGGDVLIYNTTMEQNITDKIGNDIYGINNKNGNINVDSSSINQNFKGKDYIYGIFIDKDNDTDPNYSICMKNTLNKSECGVTSVINAMLGRGHWITNYGQISAENNTLKGIICSEKQALGLYAIEDIAINSCTIDMNVTSTNRYSSCIESGLGNIMLSNSNIDLRGETVNNSTDYKGAVDGINSNAGYIKIESGKLDIALKGYTGIGIYTGEDYDSGYSTFDEATNDAYITLNYVDTNIDVKGKDSTCTMYGIKAYQQDKLNINNSNVKVKASTQALKADNIVFGEEAETSTLITEASNIYKVSDEEGNYTYALDELVQYPNKNDESFKYVKIGKVPSYYFSFNADRGEMIKVLKNGGTLDITSSLPNGCIIKTVDGKNVLELNGFNFTTIGPCGIMMKGTTTNLEIKGNNTINNVQDSHTWCTNDSCTNATYGICLDSNYDIIEGDGKLNLNKINTNYIEDNDKMIGYYGILQMNDNATLDILGGEYVINFDKIDICIGIISEYMNITNSNIAINGESVNIGYGICVNATDGDDKTMLNIESSTINLDIVSEDENSAIVGILSNDENIDTSQNNNVIFNESNITMRLSGGNVCGIYGEVNNVILKNMDNLDIDVQGKAGSEGTNVCYGILVSKKLTVSNTTATIAAKSTSSNTSSIRNNGGACNIKGKVDASTTYLSGEVTEDQLDTVIDINTNYSAYRYVRIIPSVISVDITWGGMDFTYDDGTWNPSTLNYDNKGWKANNSNKITVTNNSNVPIDADIRYNPTESYSIFTGNIVNNTTDMQIITSPQQVLVSNSMNSYLILSGQPTSNLNKEVIGSVTVTITE